MDMSSMDMGGMSMDMSGPFRPTNEKIAHGFWYGIAGAVALLTGIRITSALESWQRQRLQRKDPHSIPSRPRGYVSQAYATAAATVREMSYPQPVYFTGRISRYFSPLPVGHWLILILYWTVILCFLWSNTILKPNDPMYAYKWEIVGYRAAWVSVAQIPFIYLLSCKFNPISLLTGISYERFNWLHRWAARTVFLTVIVHWSFFLREWSLAKFVNLELQMMPMVKYGFGAWSTIGWMILSGFGFFPNLSYEVFVAQHIFAAVTLLWLLYVHVPAYARYNVYLAIGFVAFDWSARIVWAILRNTHVLDRIRTKAPGYAVLLEALPGEMVRLTIRDPRFEWKAGQHVYISIPRLQPFELHPFTIANAYQRGHQDESKQLTMVVKARAGFSRKLYKIATSTTLDNRTYRALLSGPWGSPPELRHYESVVAIACSSGASFVVPLLQDLVRDPACVRKATLHWMIRREEHLSWYHSDLISLVDAAQVSGMQLTIHVHVTQPCGATPSESNATEDNSAAARSVLAKCPNIGNSSSNSVASSLPTEKVELSSTQARDGRCHVSTLSVRAGARPTVDYMIRPTVEAALGETAVVVCGGLSITAQSRTFVSMLSDERAVHKGSGAQGIFLFSETYGW